MSAYASNEQSFQARYQTLLSELRLNPRQQQVIDATRHCVAIAGPGSGKTKTITGKIARLLYEEVEAPRGIACITYSNECMNEIAHRLEKLGIEQSQRFFLGTTHSFCLNHIVRPFGGIAGMALPDTVATEAQQKALKQGILASLGLDASDKYGLKDFDKFRREPLSRVQSYGDTAMGKAVLQYEAALASNNLTDFDEMIRVAVTLVHLHAWVRKVIIAKFPVIVVDEYQDLGYGLHRLVTRLQQDGARLIAVGDPDQSIYAFTGARPGLLNSLFESHQAAGEAVRLAKNYRCGQAIIDTSVMALDEAREYEAHSTHEGCVEPHQIDGGWEAQANHAVDVIMPQLEAMGISRGEIGFLYRDKNVCKAVGEALEAKHIGFRGAKELRYPKTPVTDLIELIALWSVGIDEDLRLSSVLSRWKQVFQIDLTSSAGAAAKTSFVGYVWRNRTPDMRLADWLAGLYGLGLREMVAQLPDHERELNALEAMERATQDGGKLAGWSLRELALTRRKGDLPHLVTIHSSKGLEYDAAIIIGVDRPRYPVKPHELKEERRKLYVAITRARKAVYLLWSDGPHPLVQELIEKAQLPIIRP